MTGKVLPFDAPHDSAQLLLPWFVNGTLSADEAAQVSAHLEQCAHCRNEVQSLQTFKAAYAGSEPAPDADAPFARLSALLDAEPPVPPARRRAAGRTWRDLVPRIERFLPWAALAGVAAVGSVVLLQTAAFDPAPRYRTLGAAGPTAIEVSPGFARIAVVFEPDLSESRLRAIVQGAGARIVDGPTTARAWILETPHAAQRDALAALRGTAGVQVAEPLDFAP